MPRKRIPVALEQGSGDIACHFLPEWMPGELDWSVPFMPNALLLLSHPRAPHPASLLALRGVPIGTVHGFEYPDVTQILGAEFVRDDAPDATRNLVKRCGAIKLCADRRGFLALSTTSTWIGEQCAQPAHRQALPCFVRGVAQQPFSCRAN